MAAVRRRLAVEVGVDEEYVMDRHREKQLSWLSKPVEITTVENQYPILGAVRSLLFPITSFRAVFTMIHDDGPFSRYRKTADPLFPVAVFFMTTI